MDLLSECPKYNCLRLKVFISVLVCTHSSVFGGVAVHLLARSVVCFFILRLVLWAFVSISTCVFDENVLAWSFDPIGLSFL